MPMIQIKSIDTLVGELAPKDSMNGKYESLVKISMSDGSYEFALVNEFDHKSVSPRQAKEIEGRASR